ncbi:CheY-P phosphatase CheC [bioreactor metagenome]|jgi:chemotaxis protein CheC|uniref:Chemotaxis protein CheC n=2 Tax=root TaxID=1 RepID=A0A562J6I1_9FIRM|nr:chemotaxis protein CheC [Sedimentibacter saalensis]MEA5095167.1 chemotaxis protein CheC [Sedimentibacter saalensis]TWH78720.1 chemotaxis protein CheC [Sedimentibacter saalensis]
MELNEIHIDILKEIGNIGAGNAATSLSQMLSKRIDMNVPEVSLLDYENVINSIGGAENIVVGILVSFEGEIEGVILFLLKKEFVHMILNSLLGTELHGFEDISEMEMSALSEIGNIMVSSYVNSISSLTNMAIDITVPSLNIDMSGALLDAVTAEFSEAADRVIFIREKYFCQEETIYSHMLLLPSMSSLEILLRKFGMEI